MINVLWLASWYPGRLDAFNGDFTERHAIAVSRYVKITVLVILKDELLSANKVKVEKTVDNNLTVYRVYYGKTTMPGLLETYFSVKKYFKLQKQLYRQIENETGRPDIVHVQVAMKAGMLALYLKKKYQIPFVLTEHWTGYYPNSKPSVYDTNIFYKKLNRKILQQAALFLPVTKDLGETINKNFTIVKYTVVPNVVNTGLFFYEPVTPDKFRFIHPSLMGYQKNPEGILQACILLKERGCNFKLLMAGNEDSTLIKIAKDNHILDKVIFFMAVVPYKIIAKEMQKSSALLLFSRFENLPCVILEALCCGLPVISSRVGGIAEVIDETNGILVDSENIEQLVNAMQQMIDRYNMYDRAVIADKAKKQFNYATVGNQYFSIYKNILHPVLDVEVIKPR
ncbi:MAG: glycosyltransferase [Ferruginibacter sp.]|nr:glycosyltransferase [Ferruginibacter sp.]